MTFRFQVCFEPEEDGGYHTYVPALPGCHSYGRTIEKPSTTSKKPFCSTLMGLKTRFAPSVVTRCPLPENRGGGGAR